MGYQDLMLKPKSGISCLCGQVKKKTECWSCPKLSGGSVPQHSVKGCLSLISKAYDSTFHARWSVLTVDYFTETLQRYCCNSFTTQINSFTTQIPPRGGLYPSVWYLVITSTQIWTCHFLCGSTWPKNSFITLFLFVVKPSCCACPLFTGFSSCYLESPGGIIWKYRECSQGRFGPMRGKEK